MSNRSKIGEFFRVTKEFAGVIPYLNYRQPDDASQVSLGALFEDTAAKFPDNTMLLFEDREWTYRAFNAEVNQLARVLASRGIGRGDTVALFMENRAEYVLSMLAVVKLGASCSLINNSLTGAGLVHCIQVSEARACIVGEERVVVLDEVRSDLGLENAAGYLWLQDHGIEAMPAWALDARSEMAVMADQNLEVTREITAGETALYIFTSGTTGLPKAAVMPHRRILAAGQAMGAIGFRVKPEDRLYLCLPIYHITGMGPGFCAFIAVGASVVLRRSFSASKFWPEIQKYRPNSFIYVGELCRYLTMQPECPEEKHNSLEKMLGNGLRPDVWDEFKGRFGISRICEIYGSSEGNVTFLNMLNKDKTIGAAISKVALVSYDHENDDIIRDANGRCIEVPLGEPGLLLGEISDKALFDGYTDPSATAKKIITGVLQDGDRWFNTGDLVRQIDVGFAFGLKHFQFVDRTGDTFRWRAENVSTNEVGEVLNQHAQIDMANVYGVEVPGAEGRAGMVAFALEQGAEFDVESFTELVDAELPIYARPVFLRVQRNIATTGTFKLLKTDLRRQAYHLNQVDQDEVYVRRPRSDRYERLEPTFYQEITSGQAGY
ncbi:long-chain-acyl-CoA synthetase [Halioglobus sp. HI00S01]|uniref:long-chain-acyl-CoA synthetase n=1 Tax=Halioglobus sp. HI00S01 TaxID=1822214 RepID=UPI0007C22EDB|nr:long-chain-acyl-CoA synthetase [Halioglobus sp. HI00S01]KZX59080.1 long-chain-acyl-CoA synthetase [Halioglobus sp. HI00S01]